MRIDPVTADCVRQILVESRARGVDPVAALDRANLLDHPSKRRRGAAILMEQTLIELTKGELGGFLLARIGRHEITTPMQMYEEMIFVLRGCADQWRKQAQTPPET